MMKKCLLLLLCVAFIPFVYSAQPTQQYYKAPIIPLYRESMLVATNYSYTLAINPPDGISSITSAIISFNAQINGQTQNFTLWVNGQSCRNPSYYIATAFSATGNTQFYFDCSNRIMQGGTYNITIRSAVATGVVSGWLDLTYINNPVGALDIMGTEYSPFDPATMFLQLKDAQGNPVQNGSCYLDVWYPLVNGTHPYVVQDAPMLQAIGDDGLYYYDMTAPSILGVYMLSAKCSYIFNWVWIYPETENIYYPIQQVNSGTWQGNSQILNSKTDALYERCDGSIAQPCSANYTFNISTYGVITNITNINVYFSGQSDTINRILVIAYWNGTSFVNLTNTLTFTGTGLTVPSAYDEYLTNSVPISAIINNSIKLRLSIAGSQRSFFNWLSLTVLSSAGTLHDLKGSSEMHITNIANATSSIVSNMTVNVNSSAVASAVWNFSSRNLTFYQNFSVPQQDLTNYSRISNLTASDVWGYSGVIVPNILNQFASIIWSYVGRYVHGILY
jgi:hypothetical protein